MHGCTDARRCAPPGPGRHQPQPVAGEHGSGPAGARLCGGDARARAAPLNRSCAGPQAREDAFLLSTCRRSRDVVASAVLDSVKTPDLYTQCQFCPVPRGDAQCDTRFFDAMRCGEHVSER